MQQRRSKNEGVATAAQPLLNSAAARPVHTVSYRSHVLHSARCISLINRFPLCSNYSNVRFFYFWLLD